MSWKLDSFTPSWAGKSDISADPFVRGSEYLKAVRQLALVPAMVDVAESDSYAQKLREPICTWVGKHIDAINAELNACLQACHGCFHPEQRRPMQILATPLAQRFGIDGLCNILVEPSVILIDVGRIAPEDWLSIVAHEYAHAHLGSPGHDQRFLAVIEHLSLGLGLEPPAWQPDLPLPEMEARLRNWPFCKSTTNSLAFWMGCKGSGEYNHQFFL